MKSFIIILALAVVTILIFNSCKSNSAGMKSKAKVKDLWLNSHRPSPKPDIYLAQFDKEQSPEAWQELVIPIEGFTYTAGQVYHLRVEETTGEGDEKSYRLIEIVSSEVDPLLMITDIYVLREIPGEMKADQLRDVRCTVELKASTMTIMGSAPCNQYSGKIKELTTTTISFGPIMATKMACPHLSVEQMVFSRLNKVRSYERKGLNLLLSDEQGEVLLILGKVD